MSGWRIPLSDLNYDEAEDRAVGGPLSTRWLSMGPEVQSFETEFAALLEVEHAVAVSSGTAALHLAYAALGIGPGDEIIQPAMNFVAAANMTIASGATPVFADIVAIDEPSISPARIEALIRQSTRAVVVMHYGGSACRMEEIMRIARTHGVAVIEDACHAVGATYGPDAGVSADRMVGSVGDIACFSFFSNKNLATGEGGMVVTDDDDLARRVRLLRSHGMTTLTWDRHEGHARSYDVLTHGFNYRLDDLRAALGRVQLSKLTTANRRRRALAERYDLLLRDSESFRTLRTPHEHSSHHLMVAVAKDRATRDAAAAALANARVQTSLHYPCITDFAAFAAYTDSEVPVSRQFAERTLSLPLFPTLALDDVDDVVALLVDAASGSGGDQLVPGRS
jgi:dTDP-4-amino-4,6-dideoxygalactose transaminase